MIDFASFDQEMLMTLWKWRSGLYLYCRRHAGRSPFSINAPEIKERFQGRNLLSVACCGCIL